MKIKGLVFVFVFVQNIMAQAIAGSPEYIKALTAEWKGERFDDGRPKVSDEMLERLKHITIEEAWAELMKLGYQNQYEGDILCRCRLVRPDVRHALPWLE